MKKLLCLALCLLLVMSMVGCKKSEGSGDKTTAPTEAVPTEPTRPSLEDFGPWVLTAEYEKGTDKLRNYCYGVDGSLLGFDRYQAAFMTNELGGKTLILTAYEPDGTESTKLSKLHYIYNADGKLVGYRRYENPGGKLADSFVFEYDTKGNITKQEKFYMDNWHETITYTYDGDQVVSARFLSSVYDASYTYVYDDAGVISQINYSTKYVKSGNVVEGSLALQKSVYTDDSTYRVRLSSGGSSEGVAQGKEVLFYEVKFDEQGKPECVTLEVKEWGIFQNGFVPMRLLGAMNPTNLSGGTAKFVYKPLDVHLAQ